jgi:tRNA pseudouridine32 synthase / 23S rRNA pseudouridine746 synthase
MSRPRPDWTPPARDGVSASRLALQAGPWATVCEFLTARLRPGIVWAERMAQGEVLDAAGNALPPDAPCVPGQVVWYWRRLPPEPRVPFELELVHQDAQLVVVDKPHFLASIPGGRYLQETALVRLKRLLGNEELVPLHRLDRETAGLLLFSANPDTRNAYHALMRERRVYKVYEAVAPWRADLDFPLQASHRLRNPPQGRHLPVQVAHGAQDEPNAHTQIELLQRLGPGNAGHGAADGPLQERVHEWAHELAHERAHERAHDLAHYRLRPRTGHRHQLRAQMNALGLPIVGDRIYPRLWPEPAADAPPDYSQPLQLLARELSFQDPVSGGARHFVSTRRLALAPA